MNSNAEPNIIAELMADCGLTEDEIKTLVLSELDGKESKKKQKAKKSTEIIFYHDGVVTFTCNTCGEVFDRTFTSNIPSHKIKKSARTCAYCTNNLLKVDKAELISMILKDRKGFNIC